MRPAIEDRSTVILSSVPPGGPVVGDMMLFRHPGHGQPVLHRVVAKHPDGWVMRGDNCRDDDGVIQPHQMIAVATVDALGRRRWSRLLHSGVLTAHWP